MEGQADVPSVVFDSDDRYFGRDASIMWRRLRWWCVYKCEELPEGMVNGAWIDMVPILIFSKTPPLLKLNSTSVPCSA